MNDPFDALRRLVGQDLRQRIRETSQVGGLTLLKLDTGQGEQYVLANISDQPVVYELGYDNALRFLILLVQDGFFLVGRTPGDEDERLVTPTEVAQTAQTGETPEGFALYAGIEYLLVLEPMKIISLTSDPRQTQHQGIPWKTLTMRKTSEEDR